jgi:hypothetical protein
MVWLTYSALDDGCTASDAYLSIQELQVWVGGINVAVGQPVMVTNAHVVNLPSYAVDGDNNTLAMANSVGRECCAVPAPMQARDGRLDCALLHLTGALQQGRLAWRPGGQSNSAACADRHSSLSNLIMIA